MQKGVQKQMNQLHSGVISSAKGTAKGFGGALGKMDNYAHSAMSNTVHQLNGGIKGIDKVLGQFGGNSSVINSIHYATSGSPFFSPKIEADFVQPPFANRLEP